MVVLLLYLLQFISRFNRNWRKRYKFTVNPLFSFEFRHNIEPVRLKPNMCCIGDSSQELVVF